MKLLLYISIVGLFNSTLAQNSTEKREKYPTFFSIHGNAILPNTFQQSKTLTITDSLSSSTINQKVSRSFGAFLRQSYNDRFSIEAGLIYSIRNFNIDMEILDSNLNASTSLKFTTYDIPINGLVFLRLSQNIYANAGLGATVQYKPSAVAVITDVDGKNAFAHVGLLTEKFAINLNGQFGMELRTQKNGFFYIGGSARVPFSNLFVFQSSYRHGSATTSNAAEFKAGYFAIDFRYYFHTIKNKGEQPVQGPVVE
ncbi:MAG: hypothetical protein KJ941_03695 [Bacteroidetes bacterium]|nr:hypothetical protein [Bacteroidota bacterium]